jgi:hypothetical protein
MRLLTVRAADFLVNCQSMILHFLAKVAPTVSSLLVTG